MPYSDTYCDNELLQKIIPCHRPVAEGLFSHEIAMLIYRDVQHLRLHNISRQRR